MFRKLVKCLGALLRCVVLVVIFVLVGEIIVGVDQYYRPFIQQEEVIRVEIAESHELAMVQEGTMPFSASDVRIMVLGDSYIYGGGIPPKDKFSNVLRQRIADSHQVEGNCYVLDLSRPRNNTLDNYQAFARYFEAFQPTHVIVGYNLNDIPSAAQTARRRVAAIQLDKPTPAATAEKPPEQKVAQASTLRRLVRALYRFEVIRYSSTQVQNQLKIHCGVVIPFGNFHRLTRQAYQDTSPPWKLTQEVFRSMAELLKTRHCQLYIYAFPEINLIERPQLFAQCNEAMKEYFPSLPNTEFFSGTDEFLGKSSEEYRLSKYDGHPNARAHAMMVDAVFQRMCENGFR